MDDENLLSKNLLFSKVFTYNSRSTETIILIDSLVKLSSTKHTEKIASSANNCKLQKYEKNGLKKNLLQNH